MEGMNGVAMSTLRFPHPNTLLEKAKTYHSQRLLLERDLYIAVGIVQAGLIHGGLDATVTIDIIQKYFEELGLEKMIPRAGLKKWLKYDRVKPFLERWVDVEGDGRDIKIIVKPISRWLSQISVPFIDVNGPLPSMENINWTFMLAGKSYTSEVGNIPITEHLLDQLSRNILTCYNKQCLTPEHITKRSEFVQHLSKLLVVRYPEQIDTRIDTYGSSQTGFGSRKSDLDLSISTEPTLVPDEIVQWLEEIGMENVKYLRYSNFPVIKFHDPLSNLDVDLSVNPASPYAIYNTQLFNQYSQYNPNLTRPFIYAVKEFAKSRELADASTEVPFGGCVNSYCWLTLGIFFLVQKKIIPHLQKEGEYIPDMVGEWDCGFRRDVKEGDNKKVDTPVGELFIEFLKWFIELDETRVISLKSGTILEKDSTPFVRTSAFYVQDPFILKRNVGGTAIGPWVVSGIKDECRLALTKLSDTQTVDKCENLWTDVVCERFATQFPNGAPLLPPTSFPPDLHKAVWEKVFGDTE